MAETQNNLRVDFAGGMFIVGIFVLLILFCGEPDWHDAILHRLMGPQAAQVETGAAE